MPVRKRAGKRRNTGTLEDWEWALELGWPCTGDLDGICELDEHGYPDREAARSAWKLYGSQIMARWRAEHPNGSQYVCWGFEQFGDPDARAPEEK